MDFYTSPWTPKGQGYGHERPTPIPFVQCQSVLLFLGHGYFKTFHFTSIRSAIPETQLFKKKIDPVYQWDLIMPRLSLKIRSIVILFNTWLLHHCTLSKPLKELSDWCHWKLFCVVLNAITMTSHERHVVSNYRSFNPLFNSLCGPTSKKRRSLHHWPFVRGIHRWPLKPPHKGPVTRKKASIWWRHHATCIHNDWHATCLSFWSSTVAVGVIFLT